MHEDDPDNFLKLSAALKVILGRSVREVDLVEAERLLGEFLQGYLKVSASLHSESVSYFPFDTQLRFTERT